MSHGTCLSSTAEIRQAALPTLLRFARAVDLITTLVRDSTARLSDGMITRCWSTIRELFDASNAPGFPWIQEVVFSDLQRPPKDWREWFRTISTPSGRHDQAVSILRSWVATDELFRLTRILESLPPRFRKALGPDWEKYARPWWPLARLRPSVRWDQLDDVSRGHIGPHGRFDSFAGVRVCGSTVTHFEFSPHWLIIWPDIGGLAKHLETKLQEFESSGDTDLLPTVAEVKAVIEDHVTEWHPGWLLAGDGPIDATTQKRLDAAALTPPFKLTVQAVRTAIQTEFEPAVIREEVIQQALTDLFDGGVITSRWIRYMPPDGSPPREMQVYHMRAAGPTAMPMPIETERPDRRDPDGHDDMARREAAPPDGAPPGDRTPPAWERLKIERQASGNDLARFDGTEYRLPEKCAELLESLQKKRGQMIKASALSKQLGDRVDHVYEKLQPQLQAIVERPGKGGRGYRMR